MFKLVKLVPVTVNFRIMRHFRGILVMTLLLMAAAITVIATRSLRYGIDFSGGVLIEIRTDRPADIEELRAKLAGFSPMIQGQGSDGDIFSIYLAQGDKDEDQISAELAEVKTILGDGIEYRSTQIVGPRVGADLVRSGMIAVFLSILVMSIYIGIRFQLPMAMGSILMLTHDMILALAMISLAGIEFNLTTLAALLTFAGYSINDTVVIYDRIRENQRKYKNRPFSEIGDLSINETFSRTVLTGVSTAAAIAAIYFLGGDVLRGFSAVMLFGIFVGAYSSTVVSTSILMMFNRQKG